MSAYDWLRAIEIVIGGIAIVLWVAWWRKRKRPISAIVGPVWVILFMIVYNAIRLCGVEIDNYIAHGSMSHAIRIMFLGLLATGPGVMLWFR